MGKKHNAKASDKGLSRRCVLTSLAGIVPTYLNDWFRGYHHQNISPSTNSTKPMKEGEYAAPTQSTGEKRLAYVTLPGLSTASLLANLPYLMNGSSTRRPIILMDIHDYNRLQAVALKETDSPWNQSLAMAYGHLLRRGVVQLIDYAEFYSNHTQKKILKQNQEILEKVPNDEQKRAAIQAAQGRINYQRGEYQESFRENLGEDLDVFINGRKTEKRRQRKLKRGCTDPFEWNEQIFNQYAAALEVRGVADEIFDHLNVKYVIGEGESMIIDENGLGPGALHIPDRSHIEKLPPKELEYTREIFETIGQLAVENTGVQHDDWMLLAPTLAIPQYDDVFNISVMQNEIERELNPERISREVADVVTHLENQREKGPDPTSAVEWLMESDIMPFAGGQQQRQSLIKMTNYAMTLAQYSDALRPLIWDNRVSQVAGLIGASIISDPSPHDDLDDLYQQGEKLIKRLDPPSVNGEELLAIRRRKRGWDETLDWYEMTNRIR
jgi:hypothetical protein